jgi:GntR family transcriptional regulator
MVVMTGPRATAPTGKPENQCGCSGGEQHGGSAQTLATLAPSCVLDHTPLDRPVNKGHGERLGIMSHHLYCVSLSSTLFDVNLDRDDPAFLHEQVAVEIRRAIADGEAQLGERLPPARHLAAVLNVNVNTVLRALRALRDEGLIEMRPRRGIRVVGTPAESTLRGRVAELVQIGRQQGYTRADLLQMVADSA